MSRPLQFQPGPSSMTRRLGGALALLLAGGLALPAPAQTLVKNVPMIAAGNPFRSMVNPVTGKVYTIHTNSQVVRVYDPSTGVTTDISPLGTPVDQWGCSLAVNPKTNKIYLGLCSTSSSGYVFEINGATDAAASLVSSTVRRHPRALAVNVETNKVYAAFAEGAGVGYIRIFDRTAGTSVLLTLACQADSAAVNPNSGRAYFGCEANYVRVDALDAPTTVSIGAGNTAQGVAVNAVESSGASHVYVLYTSSTGSFVRVMDEADTPIGTRTVGAAGSAANDIAVNPSTGRIYVANYGTDQVAYLTSYSDTTATNLTAGNGPLNLSINALNGQVFANNYLGGGITLFDHADRTTTLATGANPTCTAVDPIRGQLYAPNYGSDQMQVFDLSFSASALAPATAHAAGDLPYAVAVANGYSYNRIFVANYTAGTVSVYNSGSYDAPATLNTTLTVGKYPLAIAADSAAQTVYVANYGDGTVSSIDAFGLGVNSINIGGAPRAIAVNPETHTSYVANYSLHNVYNMGDGTTIPVGSYPFALAIDSRRKRLYTANYGSDTVSVIDLRDHRVIQTVAVGDAPRAIAVNPTNGEVWVANGNSDSVTVIDSTTFASNTVTVGDLPYDIAVNPLRNRVYVANYTGGTVSVINGATRVVEAALATGVYTDDLELDPATGDVWVGNLQNTALYRIEAEGDTLVNLGTYNGPRAIAFFPQARRAFIAVQNADQMVEFLERRPLANNYTVSFNASSVLLETSDTTPAVTITVASTFTGNPAVQAVYYSVDSLDGPWSAASFVSGNDWSATPTLTPGPHILYAYASDGQFATSTHGPGGPIPGRIAGLRMTIGRPSVQTSILPIGKVAEAYYARVDMENAWFSSNTGCSASGLPAGLSAAFIATYRCDITGTPTTAGTFPVTVTVTDENGATDSRSYSLLITPGDALVVGNGRLPDYDRAAAPYNATLVARGGRPPYTWGCVFPPAFAGALSCVPASGAVTGTLAPGVADGTYSVTATVTDSLGASANKALPLTVYNTPQILTTTLAPGFVNREYGTQQLFAVGGSGVVTWSLSAGTLPAGLTLDSALGRITGMPTAAGTANFTILYSTPGGSASRALSIAVSDPAPPPHWVRRGLAGGNLVLGFSPGFTSDRTVYGNIQSLLYKSTDGGYYWRPANLKLTRPIINGESHRNGINGLNSVAFSPDFNGTAPASGTNKHMFVSTEATGVWFSPDNDGTWFKMTAGLNSSDGPGLYESYESAVAADYATSRRIYTTSWDPALGRNALYTAVVNTVTPSSTVFTRRSPDGLMADRFFFSPAVAGVRTIYATRSVSSSVWLYRSLDSGVTWSLINTATPTQPLFIGFSPKFAADQTFAVAPYAGVFGGTAVSITRDGGITFENRGGTETHSFVQFPPDYDTLTNPILYASKKGAGYSYTLTVSTDNGLTFRPTGTAGMPSAEFYYGVFWISPDHAGDSTLFAAGSNQAGIYRTVDRGANWYPSDGGLYIRDISALAAAPTGTRYFAASRGLIFYSNNGGKAWKQSAVPEVYTSVIALATAPNYASNSRVFALADTGSQTKLLRSTDGGATFTVRVTLASRMSSGDFRNLQISPNYAADGRIFLLNPGSYGGWKFFRSTDDNAGVPAFEQQGGQYQLADTFGVSPGFATDQTIYFTDWGYDSDTDTWGYMPFLSTDGNNPAGMGVGAFATGPFSAGRNSIAFPKEYKRTGLTVPERTFFFNCMKSTDAGASFSRVPPGGAGCSDYGGVVVSPNYIADQTLWSVVGESDANNALLGLYKSSTGGTSFTRLSVVGSPTAFDSINQVQPSAIYATDATVLVATEFGLYVSRDGGATWSLSSGTESIANDITAAASDPLVAGRMFVGTESGEAYLTTDDGFTSVELTTNLPGLRINSMAAGGTSSTYLFATTDTGVHRLTTLSGAGTWSTVLPGTPFAQLTVAKIGATTRIYAARKSGGASIYTNDYGASWYYLASAGPGKSMSLDYNDQTGPTIRVSGNPDGGADGAAAPPVTELPDGSSSALWSANPDNGAWVSPDANGSSWAQTQGGNDYTLPANAGYTNVKALGINAASGGREVLIGHGTLGVYLSTDGGDIWRNVSGPGSGLEATSKNASTFLSAATAYGTTDVLVGVNGSTNGGVYLSGDGGRHWTQVNQGFDPNNLSISSLVKTSCPGCPVQYYSGSYGGGMYTRTISVVPAPFYTTPATWCTGAACACGSGAFTGPVQGGTSFKLCGSNFQSGVIVEFDGVPATGCAVSGGTNPNFTVITCATPPHAAGAAVVRVRNPDTRAAQLLQPFTYTAATGRIGNTMKLSKSGVNGNLSWNCSLASCPSSNPMRLYRSQNTAFSLYLEYYNAGQGGTMTGGCSNAAGNNSCYMDATGIMTNSRSYFWVVE